MGANTYPIEEWVITEEKFLKEWNYRNETTFALSNGYIGTRGTFDEGYPFTVDEGLEGNFINGFYESEHIMYGEWNFGFPEKSQSLLNLPDLKKTKIVIDGDVFDLRSEEHTSELQSRPHISYAVFCLKKNFFNDTATTEIYTLSLHDALPILGNTIYASD